MVPAFLAKRAAGAIIGSRGTQGYEAGPGSRNNLRLGKAGVRIGALGVVGALFGGLANCSGLVETSITSTAGEGKVLSTYPLEKTTYGGMDVQVENAVARIDHKVDVTGPLPGGPIDVGAWASSEFNGVISVEIQTNEDPTKAMMTREIDFSQSPPEINISVPAEAFMATVYQKDPTDPKAFTPDEGAAWSIFSGFTDLVQGLPGELRVSGGTETENVLRGLALEGAFLTASEGCASAAWPYLEPILEESMIAREVREHNDHNPKNQITSANVHVELPTADEIHLPDQYEDWWNDNSDRLSEAGADVKRPSPDELKCEPSSNIVVENNK